MHLNNRRLSTLEMKGRIHFRENNSDLFYKVYKKAKRLPIPYRLGFFLHILCARYRGPTW